MSEKTSFSIILRVPIRAYSAIYDAFLSTIFNVRLYSIVETKTKTIEIKKEYKREMYVYYIDCCNKRVCVVDCLKSLCSACHSVVWMCLCWDFELVNDVRQQYSANMRKPTNKYTFNKRTIQTGCLCMKLVVGGSYFESYKL